MSASEGPAEDYQNKERIIKLLRFASTQTSTTTQDVGVEDYVARMVEGQTDIYYLVSESHTNALGSPYLEAFKKRGIEVLLLSDRIDEWLMGHLQEYGDHKFIDVTRDGLELPGEDKGEKKGKKKETKNSGCCTVDGNQSEYEIPPTGASPDPSKMRSELMILSLIHI